MTEDDLRRDTIRRICLAFCQVRFSFQHEDELQEGVGIVLKGAGVKYRREVVLTPKDRIDFMLPLGIGLEVKIDGSISLLTRQLFRYSELPDIKALVVVVPSHRLSNLPREMNGKPVTVVRVATGF